jgi:nucleoside-diphosphate-sugar epimerase
MKLLIVGGTRFIGKALVSKLKESKIDFVITSRRINPDIPIFMQVICNREEFDQTMAGKQSYDVIIDFNGYHPNQFYDFKLKNSNSKYIFVSTAWIGRKMQRNVLEETNPSSVNNAEHNYILAKEQAEKTVLEKFRNNVIILRLPIVLGVGDHHKRLDYIVYRVLNLQNYAIPKNSNLLETILVNDVALIILELILRCQGQLPQFINFKPIEKTNYLNFVRNIALLLNKPIEFVNMEIEDFRNNLDMVAKLDPFWRESANIDIGVNAFQLTGLKPTKIEAILPLLLESNSISPIQNEAFLQEKRYFLNNAKN